jgi:hypothetical protein
VAQTSDGCPMRVWLYADREYPNIGLNAVAGQPLEEYGIDPLRLDDMLKVAEEVFLDVPDSEVHQIAELNVRPLYNYPDPEPTNTH